MDRIYFSDLSRSRRIRPDFDLPQVRTLLAEELKRTGDIPHIQRWIITSLLYDAPADAPPSVKDSPNSGGAKGEPPPWSMGPSKVLSGELWLDSAAMAAFGRPVGFCDYRFIRDLVVGIADHAIQIPGKKVLYPNVDPALVTRIASPIESYGFGADAYYATAKDLGGCRTEAPPVRESSVRMAVAQNDTAATLCAYGDGVLPAGFDPHDTSDQALGNAVSHIVRRAWSRNPTSDERAQMIQDMKDCMAAGADIGCASVEVAVRMVCVNVIDSAPFSLY